MKLPMPGNTDANLELLEGLPVEVRGDVDLTNIETSGESERAYFDSTGRYVVEQSGGGKIIAPSTEEAAILTTVTDQLPAEVVRDIDPSETFGEVGTGLSESEAVEILSDTEVRVSRGDLTREDLSAYVDAGLESDRTFTSRQGNRVSVTLYNSDRSQLIEDVPTIEFRGGSGVGPISKFLRAVRTVGADKINPDAIGRDEGLIEAAEDRDTRRALREQLDDTLEAEGYDPDRWNTGATADGSLILQDPETNRTRTIEAGDDLDSTVDSFGGDSNVQPESDDGGSGEQGGSGGNGLDRRAIGAGLIVAAAAAYGVTKR